MAQLKYIFLLGAEGTLLTPVDSSTTSFVLESGDGANFPALSADEGFRAAIVSGRKGEWITVTARSSDTLTVTRTSARKNSYPAGAKIALRMDNAMLDVFHQKSIVRGITLDPDDPEDPQTPRYIGEKVFSAESFKWWKHVSGTTWQNMSVRDL